MEKLEVLMRDFKKFLPEFMEVKSLGNWQGAPGKINSFSFGMNGFMPEAFENPEDLSFENGVIFVTGLRSEFSPTIYLFSREFLSHFPF